MAERAPFKSGVNDHAAIRKRVEGLGSRPGVFRDEDDEDASPGPQPSAAGTKSPDIGDIHPGDVAGAGRPWIDWRSGPRVGEGPTPADTDPFDDSGWRGI